MTILLALLLLFDRGLAPLLVFLDLALFVAAPFSLLASAPAVAAAGLVGLGLATTTASTTGAFDEEEEEDWLRATIGDANLLTASALLLVLLLLLARGGLLLSWFRLPLLLRMDVIA